MAEPTERERLAMKVQTAAKENTEVKLAVVSLCARYEVNAFAELIDVLEPDVFDAMAGGLLDMVEQLPWA